MWGLKYTRYYLLIYPNSHPGPAQIQVLKLESDKSEAQRKFETVQEELEALQVQNSEVKQENSRSEEQLTYHYL